MKMFAAKNEGSPTGQYPVGVMDIIKPRIRIDKKNQPRIKLIQLRLTNLPMKTLFIAKKGRLTKESKYRHEL